jgi:hypothetical protein
MNPLRSSLTAMARPPVPDQYVNDVNIQYTDYVDVVNTWRYIEA